MQIKTIRSNFFCSRWGDTFALINDINILDNFNFVSTAGGAFLEFLEGKGIAWYKGIKLMSELNKIALKILSDGKGILAADEHCNHD